MCDRRKQKHVMMRSMHSKDRLQVRNDAEEKAEAEAAVAVAAARSPRAPGAKKRGHRGT